MNGANNNVCVCVSVCASVCVWACVCFQFCWGVTERANTQPRPVLFTEAANQLFSDNILYSISRSCVSPPCVCVCAWGVKEQRVSEFSCLIMRVHKMNDGMHHGAICAHMGSLAFWLMCVHACVWMKCTIDSPSLACPICFWRSASWEMTERRNLCVCIFFTQPHTLIKISLPGMVHSMHIQAIR